jgi:hypothetical protein
MRFYQLLINLKTFHMKLNLKKSAIIILMAALAKVKKIIVVLGLSRKSVTTVISDAKHYVQSMTANVSTFATPSPSLTSVTALITALEAAETTGKTKAIGTKDQVTIAKVNLHASLASLASYVQTLANTNPETAVATVHLAGMEVKKDGAHTKPDFAMKPGISSGEIIMIVKAGKKQPGNDYQLSTDGVTFKSFFKTTNCKATITGLVSGTKYFGRVIRASKTGDVQVGPVLFTYVP